MSNINPWTLLILGILVGWLLSWLLELWFFRHRRLQCQRDNSRLEAQLRARNAELGAANSQISALRGELGTRSKEIDALLYQLAKQEQASEESSLNAPSSFSDDLEAILAQGPRPPLTGKLKEVGDEQSPQGEEVQSPFNTAEITSDQWAILRAAGITSEADLADVNPADLERLFLSPEWRHLENDPPLEAPPPADDPDDLTLISGIGPRYAAFLQEHGFTTFSQLAASDPASLEQIFQTTPGRTPNFESWIEQAQAFQTGE